MLKVLTVKYILLILCLGVSASIYSKPIIDSGVLMRQAVDDFFTTYQEVGLLGAIEEIDSCYEDRDQKRLYCFYMDYTARIVDSTMIDYLNEQGGSFQVNKYLNDESFSERSFRHIYKPNEYNMNEANAHLNHLYYILSRLIDQQLE